MLPVMKQNKESWAAGPAYPLTKDPDSLEPGADVQSPALLKDV